MSVERDGVSEADAAYEWCRRQYEATGGATPALRQAYALYQAWEAASARPATLGDDRARLAGEAERAARLFGLLSGCDTAFQVLTAEHKTTILRALDDKAGLADLREARSQVAAAYAEADAKRRRAEAAERERDAARAELVLLDEVCGHYALDEARFLRDDGEPYGSVSIEAGMKAREAGRRYAEREKAELDSRQAAAEAVISDPVVTEDDRHDARFEIQMIGYAVARLAPLRPAAALAASQPSDPTVDIAHPLTGDTWHLDPATGRTVGRTVAEAGEPGRAREDAP